VVSPPFAKQTSFEKPAYARQMPGMSTGGPRVYSNVLRGPRSAVTPQVPAEVRVFEEV
jgi:hypothetical protein